MKQLRCPELTSDNEVVAYESISWLMKIEYMLIFCAEMYVIGWAIYYQKQQNKTFNAKDKTCAIKYMIIITIKVFIVNLLKYIPP